MPVGPGSPQWGGRIRDQSRTVAALGTLAGEIAFSVLAAIALPRLGAVRVSAYSCAFAVPMLVAGALATGGVARAGPFVGLAPVAAIVATSVQDGAWPVPAQALGVLIVAAALTYGVGQRDPDRIASGDRQPDHATIGHARRD